MRPVREDTLPWYRQFWPWFLIALPATAVVAGFITLALAIKSDDGLVVDDYYKEGLGIHKDAARVNTAKQLGVSAALTYSADEKHVSVQLNDAAVGQLNELKLVLFHPTRRNQDQEVILPLAGQRRYQANISALEAANWRVSIEPTTAQWRISGRLSVPGQASAELQ